MKRSGPLRSKKPWPRRQRAAAKDAREGPTSPEREPKPLARAERQATYSGTTAAPVPKTRAARNRRLLDLAENKPCLLLVPGCCNHRTDTTVAAHSNWPEHGKAGARKADDHWSAWSCSACHAWLDQGGAPAEVKRAAFDAGMERQILAWQLMVAAPNVSDADRRAARWAMDQHGM